MSDLKLVDARTGEQLTGEEAQELLANHEGRWCETCQNTGSLDCRCGGDLCVCENRGEYPCPACG